MTPEEMETQLVEVIARHANMYHASRALVAVINEVGTDPRTPIWILDRLAEGLKNSNAILAEYSE